MSQSVRAAVIGVGALGRHHARLLGELPDATLVGVADPNPEQGALVAELCGTRWYADYRQLLDEQRPRAVSIVVPTVMHRCVAEECLRRGIDVLVEKPITPTLADGTALCELAEDLGRVLQVGHIERFNPGFKALVQRTDSPKYIRAERLAPYSFRSTDVSVVHDLMIHDLDLVLALNSSGVTRVEAFGMCVFGGFADVVQARLRFADGCVADLTASRVSPDVRRSLQVWSAAGCWTADLQEQTLVGIGPGPSLQGGEWPRELALQPGADVAALKLQIFDRFLAKQQPEVQRENALQEELASFIRATRGEHPAAVDGRMGVAALELVEAVLTAVDQHCWTGTAPGPIGPYAHPLHQQHRAA
ncbi:MAG: Gfo/Idh/MocA family oxidoreductase [Planctomycetaceae bacterium]